MIDFLSVIILIVVEVGVFLAIYFDDLFFFIFGLFCIVSIVEDVVVILVGVDYFNNGFCFCIGFYGVWVDNDFLVMIE